MIDFVMFFIKRKDVAAKQESLFIMLLMVAGGFSSNGDCVHFENK